MFGLKLIAVRVALVGSAAFIGVFGALGCGPSAEAQEARRVLAAINALRDAPTEPPGGRDKLLADLAAQEAKGAIAQKARDACVKAYKPLLDGKALQAKVEADLANPSQASLATLRDLAAAETKIKESAEAMPECDRASSALRIGPASGR